MAIILVRRDETRRERERERRDDAVNVSMEEGSGRSRRCEDQASQIRGFKKLAGNDKK